MTGVQTCALPISKILLSGFNLNPNETQVEFTWGGLAPILVTPETSTNATQIVVFAPSGATGNVNVRVTGQGTTGPLYSVKQTVNIAGPPLASITATSTLVTPGGTTTISWAVTGAVTQVTINGTVVANSGTWPEVIIPDSQSYTLAATGPGGTTQVVLNITVPSTIQRMLGGNDQDSFSSGQHVIAVGVGFSAQAVITVIDLDGNQLSKLETIFVNSKQVEFDIPVDLAPGWYGFKDGGGGPSGDPYFAEIISNSEMVRARVRSRK